MQLESSFPGLRSDLRRDRRLRRISHGPTDQPRHEKFLILLNRGIGYHTPESVHYGLAAGIREQRAAVLEAAYAAHPERFIRAKPQPPALPAAVWINAPTNEATKVQVLPTRGVSSDLVARRLRSRS
jgi:hypothetical protein